MGSQLKDEGRPVNWSHPMNHLPPKSPSLYNLGSPIFDPPGGIFLGRASYPYRTVGQKQHQHQRTPSTGFLPHMQPSWLEETSDIPEVIIKRGGHRRSASDSAAFLGIPGNYAKVDFHIAEEDEFDSKAVGSMGAGGACDFDKLDEEQLMSMFSDIEPFQKPPSQPAESQQRLLSANNAVSSSAADSWTSERRTPASTPENPSTPSDSNSYSEVSNEDARTGGLGRVISEQEVQSIDEGDEGSEQPMGDSMSGSFPVDSSLDPKRAKRILANRQSAQRSRVRKLQYISELERSVSALQTEVATLSPQVAYLDHQRVVLNMDNNALKQQIAALAQDKRFKDAHYESLRKEAQRLRALQQQQQHQLQVSAPPYELQQQQFSKLDLGTSTQADTKSTACDMFVTKSSVALSSMVAVAPRTGGRTPTGKGPSCVVPTGAKHPDGRMITGSTRLPSDFMVQNP